MKLVNAKVLKPVALAASRKALVAQKNAPNIMFAAGVAGVVTTTILACRGTLKLDAVLTEAENKHKLADAVAANPDAVNYSPKDAKRDHLVVNTQLTKEIVKIYAPAVVVGVISIGLLTRSHTILNQRNAALGAAYTALDKGFKEYRARVVGELGEDKDLEFRHGTETVKETIETKNGPKTIETKVLRPQEGSIYGRYFDEQSSSWEREPWKNLTFLKINQNYANDLLKANGHIFLNEVYDLLGLERSPEGQQVGWLWDGDGDCFVDFGVFDANGDERKIAFLNGEERSVYLDFNVDGVIYHLIGRGKK